MECIVYGIRDVVWQCESLDELNYLAAKLEGLSDGELAEYQAIIEIEEHNDCVQELINLADNLDCYSIEAEISDYDDLARYVLYDRDSYSYNRNTLDALEDYIDFEAFGRSVAQGEGGVLPLDKDFVKGLAEIAQENDILLIADEVQTGNGRTGTLYAYMQYGITPDIVSTAKGLGGGF